MEIITQFAEYFMRLFTTGGQIFMEWIVGIIPTVVCIMTAVNSVIKLIGTDRVERFARKITKYAVGLFPHANPGELFVYTGIAAGLQKAGYLPTNLAVRYFVAGMAIILIRGLVTERVYTAMTQRGAKGNEE